MPIVPKYAPEVLPQAPDRLQPTNWESLIPGVRAQGEREAREAMAISRGIADLGDMASTIIVRRDEREATRIETEASLSAQKAIAAEQQRSQGWAADGFPERASDLFAKATKDALKDANHNVSSIVTERMARGEGHMLSTATTWSMRQLEAAKQESEKILSAMDADAVMNDPENADTLNEAIFNAQERLASTYAGNGVLDLLGDVFTRETPLELWPKQQLFERDLAASRLRKHQLDGLALAGNATAAIALGEVLVGEKSPLSKQVQDMLKPQFSQFKREYENQADEEAISRGVRELLEGFPNSPKNAIREAENYENSAEIKTRLRSAYKVRDEAREEAVVQHDSPLVVELRMGIANPASARGPAAEGIAFRLYSIVSQIKDPEVREAQKKLVDKWASGELIETDPYKLEEFNQRLEEAGEGAPGDLRRAAKTMVAEINMVDLGTDDYADLSGRLDAVINPKREAFEYDGQTGYKKLAGVAATADDLFGRSPQSDADKLKKYEFERVARGALLAEHMTGELDLETARRVVSQVANGFIDTRETWGGLGSKEVQLTYADTLRGLSHEIEELPEFIAKPIAIETGHTRTPSLDEIADHINAKWNQRIESGLEVSQDIGFAPAEFVDEYYRMAEEAESRLIPSRLDEEARARIASKLGVPIGRLMKAHVKRYIDAAWAQTLKSGDETWGDSPYPDVFWVNAHFDAIEGPGVAPRESAPGDVTGEIHNFGRAPSDVR